MNDNIEVKSGETPSFTPSVAGRVDKWIQAVARVFNYVSIGAMTGMFALATVDLVAIKIFHWKFAGAFEVIGLLGLVTVAFAISHTQVMHGHIAVDFIGTIIPKRVLAVIDLLIPPIGLLVFAPMTWQMFLIAQRFMVQHAETTTQKIPTAPLAFTTSLCAAIMCLVLIVEFVKDIRGVIQWKTTS